MLKRNFFNLVAILVLGVLGGILAQFTLSPYLSNYAYLVNGSSLQPIVTTQKEEIFIQENIALTEAIAKVEKTIVAIQTTIKAGKILEGSGLIVYNDGLIITLAGIVPEGSAVDVYWEDKKIKAKVVKRDIEQNLVLIKIEEDHLPTVGFIESGKVKLGERVFLIGKNFIAKRGEQEIVTVNEGIIKVINTEYFKTSMIENIYLQGSPLFNIEGQLLGLNTIEKDGEVFTIPISKIRDFLGF